MSAQNYQEIERKYLVKDIRYRDESFESQAICQGYLSSNPERIVRVRLNGDHGFITVKGLPQSDGISRFEWEKEISSEEARLLFELCEPGRIEKTRYKVKSGDHVIEVDEFHGALEGLVVAEIELNNSDEVVSLPDWIGREVTEDSRYTNANLCKLHSVQELSGKD